MYYIYEPKTRKIIVPDHGGSGYPTRIDRFECVALSLEQLNKWIAHFPIGSDYRNGPWYVYELNVSPGDDDEGIPPGEVFTSLVKIV